MTTRQRMLTAIEELTAILERLREVSPSIPGEASANFRNARHFTILTLTQLNKALADTPAELPQYIVLR